jgi:hypothetical protein
MLKTPPNHRNFSGKRQKRAIPQGLENYSPINFFSLKITKIVCLKLKKTLSI